MFERPGVDYAALMTSALQWLREAFRSSSRVGWPQPTRTRSQPGEAAFDAASLRTQALNELSDGVRGGPIDLEAGAALFSARCSWLVARMWMWRGSKRPRLFQLKALIEAHDLPHLRLISPTSRPSVPADSLFSDALPPAKPCARGVSAAHAALATRMIEPRTLRELKRDKLLRLGAFALALLAVLAASLIWLVKPENLARAKPVLTSSHHPNSKAPEGGLTDGNIKDAYGVHTNVEQHPWVSVDLGEMHSVDRVKIYNRGDGWFNDSLPLKLEFSEDGKNSTCFRSDDVVHPSFRGSIERR